MKLILAGLLLGASACSTTEENAVGAAIVTGSTSVTREQAIDRVTTERCYRELACGNVGPGRTWETTSGCRRDAHEAAKSNLKACGAVDFYDLATCADAIRSTRCMSDGLPKVAACDGAKLCR